MSAQEMARPVPVVRRTRSEEGNKFNGMKHLKKWVCIAWKKKRVVEHFKQKKCAI
jgi:hypothetical protein